MYVSRNFNLNTYNLPILEPHEGYKKKLGKVVLGKLLEEIHVPTIIGFGA